MGFFHKYINIPVFIISLIIGIAMVYITMTDNRKIYVYPTPENINVLQYKDKTDTCFTFQQKEVACPKNEKDIFIISPQS
jgi:hypothetical protein